MTKLFDIEDTSDLTEGCKIHLKLDNLRPDTKKLLDLFLKKQKLSIDQILVGLNREHKMEKKRNWVTATLYNLSQKNKVRKVVGEQGVYEKV